MNKYALAPLRSSADSTYNRCAMNTKLLITHRSPLNPLRSTDDTRTRFAPDGGLALANFVRSFRTCARIRSLTTGTFNLIFKDRIAFRLSGANSVRREAHMCAPAVLETLQTYRAAKNPVNRLASQDFQMFSTSGRSPSGRSPGGPSGEPPGNTSQRPPPAVRSSLSSTVPATAQNARNSMGLPLWFQQLTLAPALKRLGSFGHAAAEDSGIEKRTCFGGPCFEGTLQELNVPESKSRGRD